MSIYQRNARKVAGVAAFAVSGALLLAACSSGGAADPESSAGSSSAAGDSLSGSSFSMGVPITESGDSPYKLIAEQYMSEFPDRAVEVNELPNDGFAQALRTQLQAGNADDIIYVTPGGGNPQALLPFAEAGFLAPLTGTGAESTIPDSSRSMFTYDGELYGQGLDLTIVNVVANAGAMGADGVTFPATYGELLTACEAVAAEGKSMYVVAGSLPPNTGLLGMSMAASRVYADQPDWNDQRTAGEVTFAGSEGWKASLEAIVEMNERGCFQPGVEGGDFGTITVGLGQGTSYAGFIPSGAAFQLGTETGGTFTVNAVPGETEESTEIFASVNNALALTRDAENAEPAKAFLEWLAMPENVRLYAESSGNLPLGDLTADDLPPQYAPIADFIVAKDYAVLPNQAWTNGEVYIALGTGIQGLFTGQTTVDAILEAMDAAWDK